MLKLMTGVGAVVVALAAAGCGVGDQSDGDHPVLVITSPTSDTVSGTVPFTADAADVSGIDRVLFSIDNSLLFEDFSEPYGTVWHTPSTGGSHTLKVEAFDPSGNSSAITKVVVVTDAKQ